MLVSSERIERLESYGGLLAEVADGIGRTRGTPPIRRAGKPRCGTLRKTLDLPRT